LVVTLNPYGYANFPHARYFRWSQLRRVRRKIALEGQGTMAKLKPPLYRKPPRYLLVMLGSAVAFFIGATVYTYVWPDKSAVAEVPGDHLPPTLPIAPYVYNVQNATGPGLTRSPAGVYQRRKPGGAGRGSALHRFVTIISYG